MTNTMVGAWTYPEMKRCEKPEEALDALHKALKHRIGINVTPVFYLGQQVVAGMNYGFLCQVRPVVLCPDVELKVVVVYKDEQGNCSIDRMYNVIQNRSDPEGENMILQGGWEYPSDLKPGMLPEKAATAFSAAKAAHLGVDLTPVCYLGEQLVAGMNYAILCQVKLVTTQPEESLKVVIIYQDLLGVASISRIYDVIQSKSE